MSGIGQKITAGTKQAAQQTARVVAQQVRDEGLEMIKSTQTQVGLPVSPENTAKVDYSRQGFVQALAGNMLGQGAYKQEENKQETDARLAQIRSRVRQMQQEEEMKARQAAVQRQEAWNQAQQPKPEEEKPKAPTTVMGKIRKGMGAAARGMKGKVQNMQKGGETRASRSKD